jgi:methylated-DNA-[protein]-cysteine S-methyltransferase
MERKLFVYKSPVGDIYCSFEGEFLIEMSIQEAIGYRQEAIELKKTTLSPMSHSLSPIAYCLMYELDAYFKGDLKEFNQKIKFISGTAFEQRVWLALKEIPYGETRSYKWIAEKIACPKAVRAVGQALGKNPLPIILPCHRVIASDGSIGGFSCGVGIKRWLLRHEGAYGKRGVFIRQA